MERRGNYIYPSTLEHFQTGAPLSIHVTEAPTVISQLEELRRNNIALAYHDATDSSPTLRGEARFVAEKARRQHAVILALADLAGDVLRASLECGANEFLRSNVED